MKMSKAYDIKILWTYATMLLEVFSQVCIKIALQLCNTVVKLGNLRLNKICVTLSRRANTKNVLIHLL